jgi:hypothetical protein
MLLEKNEAEEQRATNLLNRASSEWVRLRSHCAHS